MANLAKMAAAQEARKPTIKATLVQKDDGVHIHIPNTINLADIREKENTEKGTTSFTVVALVYDATGGKIASPVTLNLKADDGKMAKANFGIGTVNLLFRGMAS